MLTDGRQLKAARHILGLTLRDLADMAGLHRNTVLRIEAETTLPSSAIAADQIQTVLEEQGIRFDVGDGRASISFPAAVKRSRNRYSRKT